MSNRKDGRTNKDLFRITTEGMETRVIIYHYKNSDHISIGTGFRSRSKFGYEGNSNCAQFLGIYISEQILSKIFKNVEQMPMHNPGFDFICGKGYKVDVKSGCFSENRRWCFRVNRNEITDYFLCLAFNNRKDLDIEHLWLIPSEYVKHLTHINISKSKLDKWKEYEQPIDEIIMCCNKMKVK